MQASPAIELVSVSKSFRLHLQGGRVLPVVTAASFTVANGACTVLAGASGSGKSSILKMIYGSYRADAGAIWIADGAARIDVASAAPRRILALRATTLGYVSQFLRVIPRVAAIDVVAEAAREVGHAAPEARRRAAELLTRLGIGEHLWSLPPATFSGGEQQRVNIARGFAGRRPIMLLDEPTASLDAANRKVVVDLILEAKAAGTAMLGVFHDDDVRARVADASIDVSRFAPAGEHA